LDITCPKQTPTNGVSNYSGSQEGIIENVTSNVFKLEPLSFTYAILLCWNWNLASKGFIISVKVTPTVLGA